MDDRANTLAVLDQTLRRVRRIMLRPPMAALPAGPRGHPVELAQVLACTAVAEHPGGSPTVADVASALGLDHSTASRLLGRAAAEGLLSRSRDPDDRRRTIVALEPAGQRVVDMGCQVRQWAIGRLLRAWRPEDVELLARMLGRFVETYAEEIDPVCDEAMLAFGAHDRHR